MCGRYAIYGPHTRHRDQFQAEDDFDFPPRYNIAPSLVLPLVRQDAAGHRHFVMARWGLIPAWVKDPAQFNRPVNAKAETAAIKPMFRQAFRKSRVLVPADAFYEWKSVAGKKQPYLIRMRDQSPFGMAGLLEHWRGPEGEIQTFTILTTEPNPLLAGIHTRMPAIIRREDYGGWLDSGLTDVGVLQRMLQPYPDRLIEAYPVGRQVNSPANDGAELIEPAAAETASR
ncbi:MAG: SOS response-associated peptidase [Sterolibacterium sp.]|jgi:putative SOS response-associated peptidase YedK